MTPTINEAALLNHLWQSTWFALAAAVLAFALHRHHARLRFNLWLTASLKFLIPFSALAALRDLLPPHAALAPGAANTALAASQPFTQIIYFNGSAFTAPSPALAFAPLLLALWLAGSLTLLCRWVWRAHRASATNREPGVRGIFRQRLVLPPGLESTLAPAEFAAVLAHEHHHIRRHDNLWSALHMLVECIFWFHPFVWVIGERLITERERACDEAVLEASGNRAAYASAILTVCRQYLAAPSPCSAGISGGSLTTRIRRILDPRRARSLAIWQRLALASLAILAIAGPALVLASQPPARRFRLVLQTLPDHFDAASIKPSAPPARGAPIGIHHSPGRLSVSNLSLKSLIDIAYGLRDYQVVAPDWMNAEHFDLTAETQAPLPADAMDKLLRPFLERQFQLQTHRDTKSMDVYELAVAEGGLKVKPPGADGVAQPAGVRGGGSLPPGGCTGRPSPDGMILACNATMSDFASILSYQLGRPVLDQTGATGNFEIHLTYTPPQAGRGTPDAASTPAPSLFSALPQELGLKLVATKAPVETLVVDSALKTPIGN